MPKPKLGTSSPKALAVHPEEPNRPAEPAEPALEVLSEISSLKIQKRKEYLKRIKSESGIDPAYTQVLDSALHQKEALVKSQISNSQSPTIRLRKDIESLMLAPEFSGIVKEKSSLETLKNSPHKHFNFSLSSEPETKFPNEEDCKVLEKRRKQANEFARRMMQEQRERKKKDRALWEKQEKDLATELEEEKKQQSLEEDQKKKRQKEERVRELEELRKKREDERRLLLEHRAKVSNLLQHQYLYQQAEQQFQEQVLLPEIEEKKNKLAEQKSKCKSVSREELENHVRHLKSFAEDHEEQRLQELREKKKQEQRLAELLETYKTNSIEKVTELEKAKKQAQLRRELDRKQIREKMAHYASLVKETCPIETNKAKAEELKEKIRHLKHPVKKQVDTKKDYDISTLHKELKLKGILSSSVENLHKDELNTTEPSKKCILPHIQPYSVTSKSALKAVPDYLPDLKKKKAEIYSLSKIPRHDWEHDLHDEKLLPREKYDKLVAKAGMIEEQARMKEKVLHAKGGTDKNPELGEFVSDMYVDAIKAKIAVLENLQIF